MQGYEKVKAELESRDLIVPSYGQGVRARCPAHDDNKPSLSLSEGDDGKALLYCHAGCDIRDVVDALGLSMDDLFRGSKGGAVVAAYTYTTEDGEPLFRVLRTSDKDFWQERYEQGEWKPGLRDTRRVLYNLPGVRRAINTYAPIYLVEGEKDADNLTALNVVATTVPGGANAWHDHYAELLRGASEVRIISDNDEPGLAAAYRAHSALVASGIPTVAIYLPREGKDITDHLHSGYTLDEIVPTNGDWDDWDEGVPDIDWLLYPILARGTLIWCYGSKETAKSMYLLGLATELSHRGERVAYYSEEMAKNTDRRRIARFAPDKRYFRWKNGRGLDLSDTDQLEHVIAENQGTSLIILDSYERVWQYVSGSENRRAVKFAAATRRIINETGATVAVIDHTGFGWRDSEGDVHEERKPRGASAKEQQADMAILFTTSGQWVKGQPFRFKIENMKPGRLENPFKMNLEVIDTAGGGLAVVKEGERTSASENSGLSGVPPAPENGSTALSEPAAGISDAEALANLERILGAKPVDEAELARQRRLEARMRDRGARKVGT